MKGCLINPLSRAVQEGKKAAADNNVMHAKPDLRVFLKWMIAGSGSVITDVITLQVLALSTVFRNCFYCGMCRNDVLFAPPISHITSENLQ